MFGHDSCSAAGQRVCSRSAALFGHDSCSRLTSKAFRHFQPHLRFKSLIQPHKRVCSRFTTHDFDPVVDTSKGLDSTCSSKGFGHDSRQRVCSRLTSKG